MTSLELQGPLKSFAYRIVPLCASLSLKKVSQVIEGQLLKSAISAAANYRSACKAQSQKAFTSKLSIALEEMDESLFWLEGINDLALIHPDKISLLMKEADERVRILAAKRIKMQKKAATNLKS